MHSPTGSDQIELSAIVGASAKHGTGAIARRCLPGRIVCDRRAFWLVAEGEPRRRIVHTDPRKERKF